MRRAVQQDLFILENGFLITPPLGKKAEENTGANPFYPLTIATVNFPFKNFTPYSLEGTVEFGVELLVLISGLVVSFFYMKPFKRVSLYFSIYPFLAVLTILALITKNLAVGLLVMVLLYPVIPAEKKVETDGVIISEPFGGLMSMCCRYEVKERKLFIFEKNHGYIETEGGVNFQILEIRSTEDYIELTYATAYDEEVMETKKIEKR